MKISDYLLTASIIIMILGVSVFFYYILFNKLFFTKKEKITTEKASHFGGFISGITSPLFTLAAFLIIYSTIIDQKNVNQIQKFESTFFKFLDYHRANNQNLSIPGPRSCDDITGRQVWVDLTGIYKRAYKLVDTNSVTSKFDLKIKRNICFAIFYYGLGGSDTIRLFNYLDKYAKAPEKKELLFKAIRSVKHCEKLKVYFYGFSAKLNNYFAEFFSYLNFVDKSTIIDTEDKQKYAKMLISQNDIFCTNIYYFYINSDIAEEDQIALSKKYPLFENLDTNLVSFIKE